MAVNGLDGKVALVTGASRGIGAGIALRLAGEGAAVALTYLTSADKARGITDQIAETGGRALPIQADSSDPGAVVAAVERTVSELGGIDILVNDAGVFAGGSLDETTLDEIDQTWAVDVRAVFVASQAAARHMGEGGRIINIGSALAERVPVPGLTLYAMCKAAMTGLTKGLARDLAARGIAVSVVQGGLIDTDMNPADTPTAEFLSAFPAPHRYSAADDIAAAVAYLASDESRYLTGAAVSVDGGFTA